MRYISMNKWDKEQISLSIEMFNSGNSKREISIKLNKSEKAVRLYLNKLGLYFTNPNLVVKFDKQCEHCSVSFTTSSEENRRFCNRSCSASFTNKFTKSKPQNLCEECGNVTYQNYRTCVDCNSLKREVEKHNIIKSGFASSQVCKIYLLKTRGHQCEQCLNKEWNGLPIPLELDHTDGNSENNDLNNLKLLCCNCHAQTSTYKGRNKGSGRHYRRVRYAEGKSF